MGAWKFFGEKKERKKTSPTIEAKKKFHHPEGKKEKKKKKKKKNPQPDPDTSSGEMVVFEEKTSPTSEITT